MRAEAGWFVGASPPIGPIRASFASRTRLVTYCSFFIRANGLATGAAVTRLVVYPHPRVGLGLAAMWDAEYEAIASYVASYG
jgi:hypothetical protein